MCQRINDGMEVLKKEKILGHILALSGNRAVLAEEKKRKTQDERDGSGHKRLSSKYSYYVCQSSKG